MSVKAHYHFIWLKNVLEPNDEELYAVAQEEQLQQIAAWKPYAASLTLWYDGKMVHDIQRKNTIDWFAREGISCDVRDARHDIFLYDAMFTAKRKLPEVPVMFRVDMLKLLLQQHWLQHGKLNDVHVVADIDILPRDPGFNPYVIAKLHQFGVLYALKKASMHDIENGWCVTAARTNMDKAQATLCDKALLIAFFLSMTRLQHASNPVSTTGCVYESLKQALTWLIGHMFDMPLVRVTGTAPDGSAMLEEYDPFPLDGVSWKDMEIPSLKALQPLVIEDNNDEGAFDGAEQHWQLVWKRPLFAVSQLDHNPSQLVAEPYAIPSLHMYSEVDFDLLPIQYIDIGETEGVENWVKADQ